MLAENLKDFRVIEFKEIDSTNDEALRMIKDNLIFSKTLLLADKQTSGRGKINSEWKSPNGNISMSLIFPNINKLHSEFSLLIGLALWQVINFYKSCNFDLKIKYPNDLLINGKKIAGILPELYSNFLIVGIGINWSEAPLETSECINNLITINKEKFIVDIVNNIDTKLKDFCILGFEYYHSEIKEKLYENT